MIKTISFTNDVKPKASYEFNLPSLKGKTFDFTPGVNIIVGANGCGKTSLLNIIRKLTFCHKKIFSYFGYSYEHLDVSDIVEEYLPNVTLKADYTKSVFNAREKDDVGQENFEEDILNITQIWTRQQLSNSQNHFSNFNSAIHAFVEHTNDKSIGFNVSDSRDFVTNVRDKFKKEVNDHYTKIYSAITEYYNRNHIDDKNYTLVVDELDNGSDVDNILRILKILDGNKPLKYPLQIIAVIHNVALIHALRKRGNVNIIEMTDGYLDKIDNLMNIESMKEIV